MITSKKIVKQLKDALRDFGEYAFDDKGPREVMNIPPIVSELRAMNGSEAGKVMKEVAEKHDRGKALIDHLAACMQDSPDDWFDAMMEASGAEL